MKDVLSFIEDGDGLIEEKDPIAPEIAALRVEREWLLQNPEYLRDGGESNGE